MKSSFLNAEQKQLFHEIHQAWDTCYFSTGAEGQYREALMDLQRQLFHHGDINKIRAEFERIKH